MTTRRQSERYNPITGTGIPAAPTRANTSAIFGGSPGGIERMFIPLSATTRPTESDYSCERRRSTSRESLRRPFAPVSEGKSDSDECSSVSDVSECGSEAGRSRRNSNISLGKTRKPLTRTTSSRLPSSAAKPRMMKRAHSFTRENTSHPSRGTTNDTRVTHSASDLTRQAKRPGATSKIPRKQSTGSQSSRAPLKRADVNSNSVANGPVQSGNENVMVKRTVAEPQASGIPVKASGVQKRSPDDGCRVQSATDAKTGTSSGIPVKGSGSRTQQHPGSSKIPQVKRDRIQVSKQNERKDRNGGRKEMVDKENSDAENAMMAGEQLLKREGTGDELRLAKSDTTKSKLPQRSSMPRASNPKAAQQKTKNHENIGGESTTENNKQNVINESCESGGTGGNTEQHGISNIPVNKRVETKTAGLSVASSNVTQRTESSRSDTGREEKPVAENGDEFSLSRENSRSKIPIMSRKGRVSTDAVVGRVTNESEASKGVEATKVGNENERQGDLRVPHEGDSEESTVSGAKMRSGQEQGRGEHLSETRYGEEKAAMARQLQKQELEIVNEKKQQECDVITRANGRENVSSPDNTSDEIPTKDRRNTDEVPTRDSEMMTTKEHSVAEKTDESGERGFTPITPSTSVSTHADLPHSNRGHLVCDDARMAASSKKKETLLSENLKITNYTEGSNVGKNGTKMRTGSQEPGEEPSGISSKIAEISEIINRRQTAEKIDDGATSFRSLEEPLKIDKLKDEDNFASELRVSGKEKQTDLDKGEYVDEEASELSVFNERLAARGVQNEDKPEKMFSDNYERLAARGVQNEDKPAKMFSDNYERLAASGVEDEPGKVLDDCFVERSAASEVQREAEPAKVLDNCLECRMERNENEDGGEENDSHSNVTRYPTFISPRKSLVLCEHHERLKNESDDQQQREEPPRENSQPCNEQGSAGILPLASSDEFKDSSNLGLQDESRENTRTKISTAYDDKLQKDNVSKRTDKHSKLDHLQMDGRTMERPARKNEGTTQDTNTSSTDNEPAVEDSNQRITAVSSACAKATHNGVIPKVGDNPLLALSRDKKYVSGENLAPSKSAGAIKSALSLEWDDAGTELSPPNFSDEDEEISETKLKKKGEVVDEERRPSVKLMNTNEALDKLKMIQSLIMKEAESRSRKESVEEKRDVEVPEGKQRESSNDGGYETSSTLDRQPSHQENTDEFSQTSEAPTRDVSSPTIWDKINDNAISQDQTTELLNETLAKLKASPQLSGSALTRRTISSRSLPGSRQASNEQLLSDTDRPVYVYTSSWMNASGKNSVASSLSLCSANRSLPSSRQNLAKQDPSGAALKRSESLSGRIEKEKQNEHREKKDFRLSNFDEMLSEDGQQDIDNQIMSNTTMVSPVSETPSSTREEPYKKSGKMSKRKKSKNTAQTTNNDGAVYGVSMEDLADGKTTCQCGRKGCVIS